MGIVDIVLLIVIGLFGVSGMRRGFLSQVVWVVALLVGIWLSVRFSRYISAVLVSRFTLPSETTPLWAFGIIFGGAVVGIYLLSRVLEGTLRTLRMAWLDKVLGLAVGMLKGGLLISVLLSLLTRAGVMGRIVAPAAAGRSFLYEPVRRVAPGVFPYLKDFGLGVLEQLEGGGVEVEL